MIARAGRTARRERSAPPRRSRFCAPAARPAWDPPGSRGSCAGRAPPSGRCSPGTGLSRRPAEPRPRYRRYEWSRPGALLHLDVKELSRFREPGHRVTGDRSRRSRKVGYEYLHLVVDDNSRFCHVELHPRQDAATCARVLERALAELRDLGLDPPEAVMTDNAFAYTRSRRFREILASIGARHIHIPPYTPRWNGKVEALIKTFLREWAEVRTWQSSSERARALPSFVRYYNRRRPHSSLGGQPPITRVHNVCGSYS